MKLDQWQRKGLFEDFSDGDTGGGGVATTSPPVQQTDGGNGDGVTTPPTPPVQFSQEQFSDFLQRFQPQQAVQPSQPPMSEADFLKAMKRLEVGQKHHDALFGEHTTPEMRMQTLQEMLDGAALHAYQLAQAHMGLSLREIQPQLNAAQELRAQRSRQEFGDKIATLYPVLKGKDSAIDMVINHLRSQGYKSQGLEQDARTVASMTEALLRQANPNFSLTQSNADGGRQMPPMAGQRGGGSSGGGTPAKKNAVSALWD